MIKQFLRYVLPSMAAFAFSGLYSIVDGYFVGNNVGDAGLAAINIAYPMIALVNSVGTGIGIGGRGVRFLNARRGRCRERKKISGQHIDVFIGRERSVHALAARRVPPVSAGVRRDGRGAGGRENLFARAHFMHRFAGVRHGLYPAASQFRRGGGGDARHERRFRQQYLSRLAVRAVYVPRTVRAPRLQRASGRRSRWCRARSFCFCASERWAAGYSPFPFGVSARSPRWAHRPSG